ncbi:hypothetical protein J9303_19475, partial [Bacillaceae bacterium Marseille-Q3522]|nr:hypothetical protein [Bacillaceae bacterium Marseille-Q3522]
MNINIGEYSFVDCLLIDFTIDKTATKIELISEAYFPITENAEYRNKGKIAIILDEITHLNLDINSEFRNDILQPYDEDGSDFKANEVYSIDIEKLHNKK